MSAMKCSAASCQSAMTGHYSREEHFVRKILTKCRCFEDSAHKTSMKDSVFASENLHHKGSGPGAAQLFMARIT